MNIKKKINNYTVVASMAVMILLVIILTKTLKTDAKESKDLSVNKYYTSISINSGDSLWTIAEEYYKNTNDSIDKYIKNIKKINNLNSDDIHSGNNLIVYYCKE